MSDPTNPQGGPLPPPVFKDSHSAPFVYFDIAPSYGVMAGAIEVELAARILIPSMDPTPKAEILTMPASDAAHLPLLALETR